MTDLQGRLSARLGITGNYILSPSCCVAHGFHLNGKWNAMRCFISTRGKCKYRWHNLIKHLADLKCFHNVPRKRHTPFNWIFMHRFACHGALRSGFNRFFFFRFLCSAGGSILAESRYVLFHFSLPFHVESLGAEEEKKNTSRHRSKQVWKTAEVSSIKSGRERQRVGRK